MNKPINESKLKTMNFARQRSGQGKAALVSAVVLAAGKSERMGRANKLELKIGDQSLIQHTVQILIESVVEEIVVVVGYQATIIQHLLADLAVKLAYNQDYEQGQMSSVHTGLAALTRECDGIMICLSDQPLLHSSDINQLIDAFVQRRSGSILVPTYAGQRGNPIILAHEHRDSILSGGRNLGCKRFIEKNPELVCSVEMENDHVLIDMDTPEDYEEVKMALAEGTSLSTPSYIS